MPAFQEPWFTLLLISSIALVAFLYASVGHGGASGYIVVLTLAGIISSYTRPSALLLNVLVSAIAFIQFCRGGHFKWVLFWPFALLSVPAAYWATSLQLPQEIYQRLLGIVLLIPIIRLWGWSPPEKKDNHFPPLWVALISGALIGIVSGLLGIGGGILLSPLMLFMGWASNKQTAAVSALFIFVNSLAGLSRLYLNGFEPHPDLWYWVVAGVAFGLAGAWWGSNKATSTTFRYLLATALSLASVKLIWG